MTSGKPLGNLRTGEKVWLPGEPTCTRGLELLVLSTPPPISGEEREAGGQIQRPKANGLINYAYVKNPPLVAQMVKRLPTMRETQVQSLGWEDPPGEGKGNPLQYSCLENPMDGGAWLATVLGVAENWTRLSDFTITKEPSTKLPRKRVWRASGLVNTWRFGDSGTLRENVEAPCPFPTHCLKCLSSDCFWILSFCNKPAI